MTPAGDPAPLQHTKTLWKDEWMLGIVHQIAMQSAVHSPPIQDAGNDTAEHRLMQVAQVSMGLHVTPPCLYLCVSNICSVAYQGPYRHLAEVIVYAPFAYTVLEPL